MLPKRILCLVFILFVAAPVAAEPLPASARVRIATWPRKRLPQSLAFSPDNKMLAVLPGDEGETLSLLDAASGKELHKLKLDLMQNDEGRIRFRMRGIREAEERTEGIVAFSPEGNHLAVQMDQSIMLWDLRAMKRVHRYDVPRNRGEATGMLFAADSQALFAIGDSNVLRWEISSIEPLDSLKGNDNLNCLALSANGRLLAGTAGNKVLLWDGADLRALELLETFHDAEARKLLEALATGAAGDPRTRDAKEAVERMKRK